VKEGAVGDLSIVNLPHANAISRQNSGVAKSTLVMPQNWPPEGQSYALVHLSKRSVDWT
jgi:hypothetical protein